MNEKLVHLEIGPGRVPADLPPNCNTHIYVDLQRESLLRYDSEKWRSVPMGDLALEADGTRLPLPDGSVEVVTMNNVLSSGTAKDRWVPGMNVDEAEEFKVLQLLNEAARMLRIGGHFRYRETYCITIRLESFIEQTLNKDPRFRRAGQDAYERVQAEE